MKNKMYIYPVWVRIWHLVNALLIIALVVTGLSLQYSGSDFILMPFKSSVTIHNTSGLLLCASFIYYLLANHFTSNGQYYHFKSKGMIGRALKQARYYSYGVFKKEEPPFPVKVGRKFNPLQKLSYLFVMYLLMPAVIITGIAMLFPDLLPDRIFGILGIHFIDLIHIITGFCLSVFLVVHIYICTLGNTPSSNFKSMINGWH